MLTGHYPRTKLAFTPTPIEKLDRLSEFLGGPEIYIKRDDQTGLAFGGNKVRQLEYYFGEAEKQNADVILITGAVQSNYMRTAVAAARKLGMDVEVQLEERVPDQPQEYYKSGNPYLMKLMGAKFHHYPVGEDEEGADNALYERAEILKSHGKKPYVIPLAGHHLPLGSLGYVDCAAEINDQMPDADYIVTGSGSATTHSGVLAGLRAIGNNTPVIGICVRRDRHAQQERVHKKTEIVMDMINVDKSVPLSDVQLFDDTLAPGYGRLNDYVKEAIKLAAEKEGLLVDPVYTGKALAGLIKLIRDGKFSKSDKILFIHTGGTPALFGYPALTESD
ncbi:D-cysteine desulfhydrase family protein [Pseudemcibacter aquimaris]|uniref:D-cysteine desulfhydrase family protein n=1 Tax=Pseudemcibacter aquimaris TaxID=2857064 RepID=UPI002012A89D|nr:D-cysteine desulfhydrase family protein [Pseudemcibacter aquimaris]MCC3861568.1 D-cysteine desulfhydrase family protein [Pseudemcibacter aquimaris]WDU58337.1 D-cysteine desulfhydrase family protein [Pseudemcibacter aquimaris]